MVMVREKENNYNRINTDEDFSSPYTGYLYKRASSGEWQRRFFEINGKYLIYYKNDSMERVLAAVSIPQLGEIRINGEMEDEKGKGVIIQIDLKNKSYFLRTESVEEAEKWVKYLLYNRDGTVNPDELRKALKSTNLQSNLKKNKHVMETSIYNPQHKELLSESSGYSDEMTEELSSSLSRSKSGGGRSRRASDTTWQKSHRLTGCFRFW
jgi:hypothetical protein